MNFQEAKQYAQELADHNAEAISVVPYGDTFVVETRANAYANGLRRVFDAFPSTQNDPRTSAVSGDNDQAPEVCSVPDLT